MRKSKISKNEAIEIANKFYSEHYQSVTKIKKEFKAECAEKSISLTNGWDVCFKLTSEEGYVIDGPVFVLVDENGDARFN